MNGKHERFISDESRELERIRQKKIKELLESKKPMSKEPAHVTDADFDTVVSKNPRVIVDFWAAWCNPCKVLEPTIEELAKELAGKVFVGKLNVDENPDTAERFQVYSIPTLLIMRDGKEVDRIVGCVPKTEIEAALKKHFG